MKIQKLFFALVVLVAFTSCKSLKTLASRDTSSTATKKTSNKGISKQVTFIEEIEVTPGTVVTSKHKTINTASKTSPKKTTTTQTVSTGKSDETLTKSAIESADYLQLKYAMILDATVEKLTNIPLLQTIEKWWGTRYCLGGTTENCIDCSGFTVNVAKDVYDIQLPRTAQEQYNFSEIIEMSELKEGDLVFFHHGGKSKRVSHVGFYLMNNKFVHASTSNGVMISDLNDSYWRVRIKGAGRILNR